MLDLLTGNSFFRDDAVKNCFSTFSENSPLKNSRSHIIFRIYERWKKKIYDTKYIFIAIFSLLIFYFVLVTHTICEIFSCFPGPWGFSCCRQVEYVLWKINLNFKVLNENCWIFFLWIKFMNSGLDLSWNLWHESFEWKKKSWTLMKKSSIKFS